MTEILRTAGASLSLRGEGPYQLPQKRSLALVSIPQRLAAVEIADALHLRDFRSPAIFEFFNTIDPMPTMLPRYHIAYWRRSIELSERLSVSEKAKALSTDYGLSARLGR